MKKNSGSILRKIFKIFGFTLLAAVFIGTLVFLYQKSQKKPDVFEIQTAKITNIVKKTVATKFAHPMARRSLHSKSRGLVDRM